jgi:thiosulfate dehydrogenase [quinone] large subunit
MPPISHLFQPKYIAVMVLSLVGFLLMYAATGGQIDLIVWDHEFDVDGAEQIVAFVIGLILLLGSAVYLYRDLSAGAEDDVTFGQSPFASFLFFSSSSAPLWLGIRLYLGFEWLAAGWHKLDEEEWRNGDSLQGYWERAVAIPEEGSPRISYEGWREFIQYMLDNEWYNWFNWVIILGEIAIGAGLILGALTGVAAFFGAVLNVSFLLSGSTSSNPVLLILAIFVILGWRVAGYIGLDRWLLPLLGTPWQHNVGGSLKAIREGKAPTVPPAPVRT